MLYSSAPFLPKNIKNEFEEKQVILTCIKHLFIVKTVYKNVKNKHVLNWTYELFGRNYRVATLSTFSLTVSGIIIPSLKVIGQF